MTKHHVATCNIRIVTHSVHPAYTPTARLIYIAALYPLSEYGATRAAQPGHVKNTLFLSCAVDLNTLLYLHRKQPGVNSQEEQTTEDEQTARTGANSWP
jgi:hypothetical protein